MTSVRELRKARKDFEEECDRIERDCDGLARLFRLGLIDEAEFDRRAKLILGDDYYDSALLRDERSGRCPH